MMGFTDRERSRAAMLGVVSLVVLTGASETTHRAHGAHEHGRGVLNVVQAASELLIELRVPAINVVGFEHAPSNDEQRRAVEDALALFRRAGDLFRPSEEARCRPEAEAVGVALAELTDEHAGSHSEQEHEEEEEEEEGHSHEEEEHSHEEHDEEEEHSHEEHDEERHAELRAEYRFRCDAPEGLKRLEVRLFEYLQGAEALEVQLVTDTLQKATELHPGDAVLELEP